MTDLHAFCDDLGPAKVIGLYDPQIPLKAILVVDNVATGPAIGGSRMAPNVSLKECVRLARAMTLKNAAANLPHGGAKSVIFADPTMPIPEKERVIRAFGRAIGQITDYIVGPDMGTDEVCMAWIRDEIGRAAGLPREVGGIPLDEIGATGFGLAIAAEAAAEECGFTLDGARIVVQGYGAVGRHAARFLAERGAVLVAASDSRGTIFNADGLPLDDLNQLKAAGRSVGTFTGGTQITSDDLIGVDCDIWIPAARPDVITAQNVDHLNTKLVLQGANIPVTQEAEAQLHKKKILTIPDFVANAGGVICASVEYHGGTERSAFTAIEEKIRRNVTEMLALTRDDGLLPRKAAEQMARSRIETAMRFQRR